MAPAGVALSWDVTLAVGAVALLAGAVALWMWRLSRDARASLAELHASRDRYRALAANLPDVSVLLFDADLRFTLVEGAALQRHGWRREDLEGRPMHEVVPPARAEELAALFRPALAGESGGRLIDGVRGGEFWMDVVPVRDGAGRITGGMCLLRDVTGRRELVKGNELLGAMLAELSDRLVICDERGRLLAFDPEARALRVMEGCEELDPLDWAEHTGLHTADGSRRLKAAEVPLYRALHGEVVEGAELTKDTPEGRRLMHAAGRPVRGADGEPLGAVIVSTDITDRRDVEARLRESEERYRTVVEGVRDTVFQTDIDGNWTFLSAGFSVATGFEVADVLGQPCWDIVHPDDRAAHARVFGPLIAGQVAFVRHRHRVVTATGAVRWAEVRAQLLRDADGRPASIAGVSEDVTDAHRAQQYGAAERAVLDLLTRSDDAEAAMAGMLEVLARKLEWDVAELWTPDAAGEHLEATVAWRAAGGAETAFETARSGLTFEMGDGLPGLAWAQRRPAWSPDVSRDPHMPRHAAAAASGMRSALAIPIARGSEPIAVVLLVSRERREPDTSMDRLLESIASHIAVVVERRRDAARIAEHASDLTALSRTAHLLASETDLAAAGVAVCRAAVEVGAADCAVLWLPDGPDLLAVASVGTALTGMRLEPGMTRGAPDGFATGFWQPIVHEGEAAGVLALAWVDPGDGIDARRREMLGLLASEAAVAVHRAKLLEQLRSTARTDALTGLANRRAWDDELTRELARSRRYGGTLCLALLDVDHFKRFNDTHGHQAGDQLLAEVARDVQDQLRPTDTLARYGGEEFAVLLPHCELEFAEAIAERLLAVVPGAETASCGVAVWDGAEAADAYLARADAALYEAKRNGRARTVLA